MDNAPELKTIDTIDTSPFKKMVMTIGELPTSFVESMTYYEALAWFADFLQKTVIPTVNNNAEAVEELQALYIELHNYVKNYFDNLDVQEEINNKLDAMVEDGTLQEIIADYLNSKAVFGFDTVASMKTSTNLINGSFAKTLGYYSKKDGGEALYKIRTITNADVVDEGTIISLQNNTLVAELIFNNTITTKQMGCYGDDTHDDTSKIQNAINILKARNGGVLIFNDGTYLTDRIVIDGFTGDITNNLCLKSQNKYGAKIHSTDDYIILIDNHGEGIEIDGLLLKGNNTNTGIHANCAVANSIFKNIKIDDVNKGIYINQSHWLLTFDNIVIKPATDGIYLSGNGTTSYINNMYVYGGSGIGYHLGGGYSTATNLACDNFSGIPYQFNYSNWTIDSLGCESPTGENIIKLQEYCNVNIGSIYTLNMSNSTTYFINTRTHNNLIIGTLQLNSGTSTNLDTQLMTFGDGYDVVQIDKISTINTTFKTDNIEFYSRSGKCTAIIEGVVYRIATRGNAESYSTVVFNDDESIDYYYGANKASIIWCGSLPTSINGSDVSWLNAGKAGKVMLKTDFSANKGILGYVKINSGSENYRDLNNFAKIPLIMSDSTSNRPATNLVAGQSMYDSTLGKPIWYTGSGWVDATGTSV